MVFIDKTQMFLYTYKNHVLMHTCLQLRNVLAGRRFEEQCHMFSFSTVDGLNCGEIIMTVSTVNVIKRSVPVQ